jgi:branched-chain amino acid transport system permease protein
MQIIPYMLHIGILILIYIILAVSLNLALGYTGLLNLGHVAFFGIGAYTSALLTLAGVPYIVALLSAGLFTSIFGYFLVTATNKLRGDYLALATLGFSFVVYSLFQNLREITRGPLGLPGIPSPSFFGYTISSNTEYFFFALIICALTIFIINRIVKSPFGRLLQATRDDDIGVRVLGKNTFKLKYSSMMISAFFAGIAGSLFAHYITFIDPGSFYLNELILILTIVIVGGIASMRGNIIATIIIVTIPELLRFLDLPSPVIGPMRQIVYALILVAILLYRPRGILGRIDLE